MAKKQKAKHKLVTVDGLGQVPRVYQEAWAVYEAFRRLGFDDDDITAQVSPGFDAKGTPYDDMMHVVLNAQGHSFVYSVCPIDRSFEDARDYWEQLRRAISDGTIKHRQLEALWDGSEIGSDLNQFTTLAMLLKVKGFRIPAMEENG